MMRYVVTTGTEHPDFEAAGVAGRAYLMAEHTIEAPEPLEAARQWADGFSRAAPSLRSWQAEVIVHSASSWWWRFSVSGRVHLAVSVTTLDFGRNVAPSTSMGEA